MFVDPVPFTSGIETSETDIKRKSNNGVGLRIVSCTLDQRRRRRKSK